MKTTIPLLAVSVLFLSVHTAPAPIVGYVNSHFKPGDNLFNNPLDDGVDTLTSLFYYNIPNGTTISLWNSTTSSFDTTSTYSSGSWSVNLTLQPGTGALLDTPLGFTNTFVGNALNHDGTSFTGFTPPPGIYRLRRDLPVGR